MKDQDAALTDLNQATPEQLVAALSHPTMLWRLHAQRLLVERGQRDIEPELIKLIADLSVDQAGLNVAAIHALWALDGLDAIHGASTEPFARATQALRHPSAGVRRNAIMVLPPTEAARKALLESDVLADDDAQVQLAAVLALADVPPHTSVAAAVARIERDRTRRDRWLDDAITSTAAMNGIPFLQAIATHLSDNGIREGAVGLSGTMRIAEIVSEHVARGKPSYDDVNVLFSILAAAEPTLGQSIARGLTQGWPEGYQIPISDLQPPEFDALLSRYPVGAKVDLIRLLKRWYATPRRLDSKNRSPTLFARLCSMNLWQTPIVVTGVVYGFVWRARR